jgi:arsenate reductase
MITVYGIRQCDTCRKALKWLDRQGIPHRFHDLRADGLAAGLVKRWLRSEFADSLVNRRSTTWRQLTDAQRQASGSALVDLLLEYPTLVKRPVFWGGGVAAVGFNTETQNRLLDTGAGRAQ